MSADNDPTQTTSRPKYHAVITYVPEEFIWCDWLHRQLDGTVVPGDLANKRTKHGFPRPPLIQVFPDPRNPAHLARHATAPPPSRHLIVICSPHSAAAPALEEQIRAFKRAEGEDRIVVLVVDGDPEHDTAPVGHDDATWLPAWLRWRLDKKGHFRPAEESEPQIIDARADKLGPSEARAHLLAALLDVPRESLRAYGDLVSASSSETLVPVAHEQEPVPVASAGGKGSPAGLVVVGLIVAVAAGAYWWTNQAGQPAAESAQAATTAPMVETTPAPATPTVSTPKAIVAATPAPTPVATPPATPTPKPATPAPVPSTPKPAMPAPSTPAVVAAPANPTPVAKPPATSAPSATIAKKATPKAATPPKKVVAAFAPSEGPQTPVTSISTSEATSGPSVPSTSWQRMRDLGDTLMSRENRDAGIIALTQSTEIGLRTASARTTSVEERIDIGRLCFRVGALQKQFMNARDARRTLESARGMLQSLHLSDQLTAGERDRLVADINQLLDSVSR
jgi:hypothetical protein